VQIGIAANLTFEIEGFLSQAPLIWDDKRRTYRRKQAEGPDSWKQVLEPNGKIAHCLEMLRDDPPETC